MNQRQQAQQQFDQSESNLIVGNVENCPIPPKQLALVTRESEFVIEAFENGLTAEVYHLRIDGKDYTLKKKRPTSRVKNLDGQYSFLNEVQRRHDFQHRKDNPETALAFTNIVNTIYADYRQGIILSDWIEGEPITTINTSIIEQLFSTLIECEKNGLFEWDLCAGNILIDKSGKLWLFDFGYMYPLNPLTELNSNGVHDPIFNFCERFETRFFSGWLLKNHCSYHQSLALFRLIKHAAIKALSNKLAWLNNNFASTEVIQYNTEIKQHYQSALISDDRLEQLYIIEIFRSHVLDIEDDLEGKSCTPITVERVRTVIDMLKQHYLLLKQHGALFYHNENKQKTELIEAYQTKLLLAKRYQL